MTPKCSICGHANPQWRCLKKRYCTRPLCKQMCYIATERANRHARALFQAKVSVRESDVLPRTREWGPGYVIGVDHTEREW